MATPANIKKSNLPTVAIVGRINVGKSSLFNRLVESHKALVSPIAGTTRTNNEDTVLWRGKFFKIIDTGGLTFNETVQFETEIQKQSQKAIKGADIIMFVLDGQSGIQNEDKIFVKLIKNSYKPVILVINKIDNQEDYFNSLQFKWESLSCGEPNFVSAGNGRGSGDLLDKIHNELNKLKKRPKTVKEEDSINVSIIGKPNVGKSSLFNKLIGEEKVIVSPIAHTTREPHNTLMEYTSQEEGKEKKYLINFIDTAGIRRKTKVEGGLEKTGIQKSLQTIDNSDIILFVLDGAEDLSQQDMQLGGLLEKRLKSTIIIINKWDLSEDNSDKRRNNVKKMIYSYFPHLDFAPILFASGLTSYKAHQIFPLLIEVWKTRHLEISDYVLQKFIKAVTSEHRPARGKGTRQPEIVAMKQLKTNPPIFEIFIKYRTSIHPSYVKYLENRLREKFNFIGTPIMIKMTKMKR